MRRGATRLDFLVGFGAGLLLFVIAAALVLPMLSTTSRGPRPFMSDASNQRSILQGFVFASQNDRLDRYPIPSVLDAAGATVSGPAAEKDTTDHIYSFLIYNGVIDPEVLVSPVESGNVEIVSEDAYDYALPRAAVDPANALWDPSFRVDFTNPAIPGHASYAHLRPSKELLKPWGTPHATANEPIVSSRPPEIATFDPRTGDYTLADSESNTFAMYKPRNRWSGYVAYNDGHVAYADELPATIFFDEPGEGDPDKGVYDFVLGIFTESGPTPADFRAIYD